jgi:L-iditol 2-dehydrogenase
MNMKAAIYYGPGDIRVEEIKRPQASDGVNGMGIVLKIGACGICHIKDMPRYKQSLFDCSAGIAHGHEFCGEVVEVGPNVTVAKVGDKVYGLSFQPCLNCDACRSKNYAACSNFTDGTAGTWTNGGFAEYLLFPFANDENVIVVPETMSFRDGALIEPLYLSFGLANKAQAGDVVVIFGQDIMGLATVACLKEREVSKIIVSDISKKRLKAAEEVGADVIVNELEQDVVDTVLEKTGGRGADVVIETAGRAVNFQQAIDIVKNHGNIWFGTTYDSPFLFHPSLQRPDKPRSNLTSKGFTMQCAWGTLGSRSTRRRQAVELLQSGKISAEKFVTHAFPLEKIKEAFEVAINPHESIKVVIEP